MTDDKEPVPAHPEGEPADQVEQTQKAVPSAETGDVQADVPTEGQPGTAGTAEIDEAPPAQAPPTHPRLAEIAASFPQVVWDERPGQDTAQVDADSLVEFMTACRDAGYSLFSDLTAVDHLRRRPRFDIVTHVTNIDDPHRLRVKVRVGDSVPSITSVYAGANFYEREVFDMFGVEFPGHPDLTRILMPDDWEGYPLRKDYAVGSVPVQFKEAHRAR